MIVNRYVTDLFCDAPIGEPPLWHFNQSRVTYTGRNRQETIRVAKQGGWVFHKNGKHTCPACVAKRKGSPHA